MTSPTDEISPEVAAAREAHLERMQVESGAPTAAAPEASVSPPFLDTYSYMGTFRSYFPHQENVPNEWKQYVECKKMSEGLRRKFEMATKQKVTVKDKTRDMEMGVDQARNRGILLELCVVGWQLFRARPDKPGTWEHVPFSDRERDAWLDQVDPAIVEKIEEDIRANNPWMTADETVEAVDAEIDRLKERRQLIIERDLAKSNLS